MVLSTLPRPTAALDTPDTSPVKVGLAIGAFASRAFCVAVEMGFKASVVLSTLPRPTAALDTPATRPVKVGFAVVAYALKSTVNVLFANVKGDAADFVTVNVSCFVPIAVATDVEKF